MVKPGTIAFPVILALGAITGYLTYTYFGAVTPQEGTVVSPYREELSAASGSNDNNNNSTGGGKQIDESQFSQVVTVKILEGSSVQGNPDYDPDAATASSDALITWVNEDTTLHTATSGTGPDDAESGQRVSKSGAKILCSSGRRWHRRADIPLPSPPIHGLDNNCRIAACSQVLLQKREF